MKKIIPAVCASTLFTCDRCGATATLVHDLDNYSNQCPPGWNVLTLEEPLGSITSVRTLKEICHACSIDAVSPKKPVITLTPPDWRQVSMEVTGIPHPGWTEMTKQEREEYVARWNNERDAELKKAEAELKGTIWGVETGTAATAEATIEKKPEIGVGDIVTTPITGDGELEVKSIELGYAYLHDKNGFRSMLRLECLKIAKKAEMPF